MDAGKRDQLISFERSVPSVDEYGGQTQAWSPYLQAWAQVRRGTGQERREASQEAGSQVATFVTDWSAGLEAVKVTDRITYRGDAWDITDTAPDGTKEIQFTATRAT